MHVTQSLSQGTNWPMNPSERLARKNLFSSFVIEGIDHLKKNLDNI
jgi:hypothetical protein